MYSFFVHLGNIFILVLRFYSGLSGRVRTVYQVSVCVVSLLSSRFTASAFVWFSNFLKYILFHFLFHWALCSFVDLHGSCSCLCTKLRSERKKLKYFIWKTCFPQHPITPPPLSFFYTCFNEPYTVSLRIQEASSFWMCLYCVVFSWYATRPSHGYLLQTEMSLTFNVTVD
jgi:hypothetical protein